MKNWKQVANELINIVVSTHPGVEDLEELVEPARPENFEDQQFHDWWLNWVDVKKSLLIMFEI